MMPVMLFRFEVLLGDTVVASADHNIDDVYSVKFTGSAERPVRVTVLVEWLTMLIACTAEVVWWRLVYEFVFVYSSVLMTVFVGWALTFGIAFLRCNHSCWSQTARSVAI